MNLRDRYLITITTIHGTRHFNLHQIMKRVIIYTVIFLISVLAGGYFYIDYLTNSLTTIEDKRNRLLKDKDA